MPPSEPEELEPRLLSVFDVALAPRKPGIYAWYAHIPLAERDWEPSIKDGRDDAGSYLINALQDFARFHQPSPIRLKGDADYELPWAGTLTRSSLADDAPESPSILAGRLQSTADSPEVRRILIRMLRAATPIFATPLYVGVAANLHQRLATHLTEYDETQQKLKTDHSGSARRLASEGGSFGIRAAAAGIRLDHLDCWVLPVSLPADSPTDSIDSSPREIAAVAEWVLQRIFLPPLGRR